MVQLRESSDRMWVGAGAGHGPDHATGSDLGCQTPAGDL